MTSSRSFWNRASKLLCVAALALTLTGCISFGGKDQPTNNYPTPRPHAKIGNPYKIAGKTYVPRVQPNYNKKGVASWYGQQFHGKLTANGELFDMNRLSAAHKTLPLPSLVRVTNLENGRSAVLRLNDRGPFSGDRVIDLSRAAAIRLGTKEQGLGRVRVEYLGAASLDDAIVRIGAPENYAALNTPMMDKVVMPRMAQASVPSFVTAQSGMETPRSTTVATSYPRQNDFRGQDNAAQSAAPVVNTGPVTGPTPSQQLTQGYYVRIGSFANIDNVRAVRNRLPLSIPVHVETENEDLAQSPLHHVRLGPYGHEFAAIEAQRVALESGYGDAVVVLNDNEQ